MTANIVNRLQGAAHASSAWGAMDDTPPFADWADLMDEAAKVIEDLVEQVKRADAEIERLRVVINEEVRR